MVRFPKCVESTTGRATDFSDLKYFTSPYYLYPGVFKLAAAAAAAAARSVPSFNFFVVASLVEPKDTHLAAEWEVPARQACQSNRNHSNLPSYAVDDLGCMKSDRIKLASDIVHRSHVLAAPVVVVVVVVSSESEASWALVFRRLGRSW